jgi:hypothetical protein
MVSYILDMTRTHQARRDSIRRELEGAREAFRALLDSLTEEDWQRKSLNPGWTKGEILVHMVFGFTVAAACLPLTRWWGRLPRWTSRPFARLLDAVTGPFNWINGLGARGQGKVFTRRRIGPRMDRTVAALLRQLDSIREDEWERGMYYPARWDPSFADFMTLEAVLHYPAVHFEFHRAQISP